MSAKNNLNLIQRDTRINRIAESIATTEEKNFLKVNIYSNDLNNEKLTKFINEDNELFIYRFTDNYFPLENLKKESNINLYNYYIFNRFYEEFEFMDESEFDDEFYYYVKNTYLKTFFTDILKLTK